MQPQDGSSQDRLEKPKAVHASQLDWIENSEGVLEAHVDGFTASVEEVADGFVWAAAQFVGTARSENGARIAAVEAANKARRMRYAEQQAAPTPLKAKKPEPKKKEPAKSRRGRGSIGPKTPPKKASQARRAVAREKVVS